MSTTVLKFLARLIAPIAVSSIAMAANDVVTVTLNGVNTDVTLRDDGSVLIDKPWPVPNETVQLPGWIIPPCPPPDLNDITVDVDGQEDAKQKAADAIATALLLWWIDCCAECVGGGEEQFAEFSSSAASMAVVIQPNTLWGQPWVDLVVSLVDPYLL